MDIDQSDGGKSSIQQHASPTTFIRLGVLILISWLRPFLQDFLKIMITTVIFERPRRVEEEGMVDEADCPRSQVKNSFWIGGDWEWKCRITMDVPLRGVFRRYPRH